MTELVRYEAARHALAEAHRVDEVKSIRDKAVAMQEYARQAKDRDLIAHATEIRLRAERRAGELLREMAEAQTRHAGKASKGSRVATPTAQPTLAAIGVSKTQSSRWQRLADLPERQFEELADRAGRKAVAVLDGSSKRTRQEMRADDENRVRKLRPTPGKFRTLVIDPPWDYDWLSIAGRATPGYATMTHDELLALPVEQWAEDDCHLYLWTTNNFVGRAVELMARWGFQHKTMLTWVKPRWGLGSYFRNSTEQVLFGVRGELRTRSDSIGTHFEAPVGQHSEKPEKFYEIVRAASFPSYGEVFQRDARPDFTNVYQPQAAAAE